MSIFNLRMSDYSKEVKSRYITPFCWILAIVAFANTYIYSVTFKANVLALVCFLSAVSALILPLVKHHIKSHTLNANIVVIIFFICITSLSVYTGGIFSNPVWWLGTIPLAATFLLNAFFGIIWFVIILINFITIFYLGQHSMLPTNVLLNVTAEGRVIVSFIFNASLISGLCILADLIRDKAFFEKEELKLKTFQLNQVASIGKLAAGVAHEINNPLTVIKAAERHVERLMESNLEVDKIVLASYMKKIHVNVERIGLVTGLMRSISEEGPDRALAELNLKELLLDVIQMLSEECLKESIHVETSLPDGTVLFNGIYTELFHAFFNLLQNSIQELSGQVGARLVSLTLLQTEKNIVIFVKDNGSGIAPQMRERIFDPFYTTKLQGVGRGLGLSFSLNTFVSNGGSLELLDELDGSVFKVTLPRLGESNLNFRKNSEKALGNLFMIIPK